ncbi:MAG: energy-coupling factor transporter ATPase [Eubacterium sp.]|nr:energy-coupling factor transporter ATPase [Eubacterium sp.]
MSIRLENVYFTYSPGSVYEKHAIKDICLTINDGEFVGLIGHTGSGKSTLIQHLNALMQPTSGKIYFNDEDIWRDGYNRRNLRFHVGLVFQYPEHQLFESDVITDVCFGPKNQGHTSEECEEMAKAALASVGIGEKYYKKSPFELSGGEKRRVAIAGVLAMNPDVLIMDEPTAGLDPAGRDEILELIAGLHRERGITVVLVSHSMEDVAKYVDRLIVMNDGCLAYDGTPREVFKNYRELEQMGLSAPQVTYLMHDLKAKGFDVDESASTLPEAKASILSVFGKHISGTEA